MSKKRKYSPELPRFTRHWWLGLLRNSIWIVVVTALVWIYADMEFTEAKDFTTTIHFGAAPNSKLSLSSRNDAEVAFRAQPHATFKLLFNALYHGDAQRVPTP